MLPLTLCPAKALLHSAQWTEQAEPVVSQLTAFAACIVGQSCVIVPTEQCVVQAVTQERDALQEQVHQLQAESQANAATHHKPLPRHSRRRMAVTISILQTAVLLVYFAWEDLYLSGC